MKSTVRLSDSIARLAPVDELPSALLPVSSALWLDRWAVYFLAYKQQSAWTWYEAESSRSLHQPLLPGPLPEDDNDDDDNDDDIIPAQSQPAKQTSRSQTRSAISALASQAEVPM